MPGICLTAVDRVCYLLILIPKFKTPLKAQSNEYPLFENMYFSKRTILADFFRDRYFF